MPAVLSGLRELGMPGVEQGAPPARSVLRIEKLDCPTEEGFVRKRLASVNGIRSLEFDLPGRKLTVTHAGNAMPEVFSALRELDMPAVEEGNLSVRSVLRIEKMDCPTEEGQIRKRLATVSGVRDLEFDLLARRLTVEHEEDALPQVLAALKDVGMPGELEAAPGELAAPPSGRTVLRIDKMDCPTEEGLIRKRLASVSGINSLEFDLLGRKLIVEHSGNPMPEVLSALKEVGMPGVEEGPPPARTVLVIEKMDCPTEEGLIRKRLASVTGVRNLEFDLLGRRLTVDHEGDALPQVLSALKEVGMPGQLAAAPGERTILRIDKMDCPTEEGLIRKRLGLLPEVQDLAFDLVNRKLTVAHTPSSLPAILEALSEVGMPGQVDSPAAQAAQVAAEAAKASWVRQHWTLLVGGVLAFVAELCALVWGNYSIAAAALSFGAIALSGTSTYRKGLIALRHRSLNINALMSIAVTGAVLIGQWPEAAMVMFLFGVAEAIEARSLERAKRAVQSLMSMAPETATVRTASGWETLPVAAVGIGAIVRVRPAERIPLDGVITTGFTAVDQAPITGESVPVDKTVGDPLFAGTVNQNGEVQYRTTAAANDSTLARIVRTVQEAQASRAPTQRFVDQFSAYYTPAVVALAVVTAVAPPLFAGGDWFTWIYRALVMLVVACPCALVISTPVTVVSGLTAAARRGILIKGGKFLEGGSKLTVLALDKTGTLTRGKPAVTDFVPLIGDSSELLRLSAALSSRSDHPISRAVTTYADASGLPDVDSFAALQGRGVEGRIDGKHYFLGNHRLLKELGASSPELERRLGALEEQGKTVSVLVEERTPLAVIGIADTMRPESVEAVSSLKKLGVRPVMLTGDNAHTARTIAHQVGIEDVRAELMPQDKLQAVAELQAGGASVGMVGDGANDAPALAKADCGFAMGAAGTDAAIETADVALMDDDPRKLASFIALSRKTKAVLWQNIIMAVGLKAVFLVLTFTGQATLWMAVFADMGTSLLVVFNGMRLLRHR